MSPFTSEVLTALYNRASDEIARRMTQDPRLAVYLREIQELAMIPNLSKEQEERCEILNAMLDMVELSKSLEVITEMGLEPNNFTEWYLKARLN